MFRTVAALAAILLASFTDQALAQVQAGDAAGGQKLVQARCIMCHTVDGPVHPRGRQGPSLAAVAQMPSTTSMSLHAFLLTPHPSMPNYQLAPQEVDDVVAYILSLRKPHVEAPWLYQFSAAPTGEATQSGTTTRAD